MKTVQWKRLWIWDGNFEEKFLTQGKNENRTIDDTLNLGWELLGMLPKSELDRVSDKTLEKYYRPVEDEEV